MYLYLMNDDKNSFDYVISMITSLIPSYNTLQAEQIARLVHTAGKCEIYSGFAPDIFLLYAKFQKSNLNIQIKNHKS